MTYPVNATTYGPNWSGSITGTAAASGGATLSSVGVALENTTTSKWWNGSSFSGSSADYVTPTGTTSWSLSFAGSNLVSSDTYSVVAQATDTYGNVGSTANTFTYSTAAPSAAVTYPANATTYGTNWSGSITGTAAASGGATISGDKVALENTTTSKWWNGSSFGGSSTDYVAATGTTSWSLSFAGSNLVSSDSYSVVAQATDSAGNVGTSTANTFTYSTAAPSAAVTYPVNATTYGTNWSGTITGSASSNAGPGTSISSVGVALENTTTSKWWNGSSFGGSSADYVAATGTTSWSLSFAGSNLVSSDSYSVVAQATDSAGNVGTSTANTFTYSTAAPSAAVTYPVNATTYGTNWSGSITGTAAASGGATLSGVGVALENTTTSKWWNGSSFSGSSADYVAATGTTSWSLGFAGSNLVSSDSYSVVAQATDTYGNVGTDRQDLHLQHGRPERGRDLPGQRHHLWAQLEREHHRHGGGQRRGDSLERGGGPREHHDVEVVERLVVQRVQRRLRHPHGDDELELELERVQPGLRATRYSVVAQATDTYGNVGSTANTFTYSTAAPSAAVTYPANATTYGTNWSGSITGTAAASGRGDSLGRRGRSREHHDVEVVERLVVRRVERRLRRSHGDDELEPDLRREQPGLERQLLGGGPGDRLGHQRGHEHRQHLHLQHGRPECGRDLPGQCHHLWDQLERDHHRQRLIECRAGTSISSVGVALENTTTSKWWTARRSAGRAPTTSQPRGRRAGA